MGTLRADTIVDGAGTGAPSFTNGISGGNGTVAPATGSIGEVLDNTLVAGSLAGPTSVLTLSVTAGVWDIQGTLNLSDSDNNDDELGIALNTTSGSVTGTIGKNYIRAAVVNRTDTNRRNGVGTVGPFRILVTSTTTYHLNAETQVAGSTGGIYAYMRALRVG